MRRTAFIALLFGVIAATAPSHAQNAFGYVTPPDSSTTSTDPVGSISSTFAVSPLGAATYTIPIECPQGLPGATPQIAITYNSQAGNGVAGYGCSISGISVITRVPRDIFHDRAAAGISYTPNDAFSLDGQRLILTQAAAGSDSAVYCLENDPRTRIVMHGLASQTQSDQHFVVEATDGTKYEYGLSQEAQLHVSFQGVYKCMAWYLSKKESTDGNKITYFYSNSANSHYPYLSQISYGWYANTRIEFEYENRPDTIRFAMQGSNGMMTRRLKAVKSACLSGGEWNTYRKYTLSYNQAGDGTDLKFSRLVSVTESNGEESLRPTNIMWNYLPSCTVSAYSNSLSSVGGASGAERKNVAYLAIDANGDGLSDVVRFSRVQGSSVNSLQSWTTYVTAYHASLNSQGNVQFTRNEIGALEELTSTADGWNNIRSYPSPMDADGDGQSELLIPRYFQSFDELRRVDFQLFRTSQGGAGYAGISYELQLDDFSDSYLYTVADFNGDGRDEIAVMEEHSDGTGYPGAILWSHSPSTPKRRHLRFELQGKPKQMLTGDFNGDGLTDIMVFYGYGYGLYINDGTWVREGATLTLATGTHQSYDNIEKAYPGDFNGDGTADILYCRNSGSDWYVSMGKGDGVYPLTSSGSHFVLTGAGSDINDHFSCMVYDMDGDGRSDAVITKKVGDTTHTYWMKSNGTTLSLDKHTTSTSADDAFSFQRIIGDFNGDGMQEMAAYGRNCNINTTSGSPNFYIYRNTGFTTSSGRVSKVTDGMGNYTYLTYRPLTNTDTYTKGTGAVYPVADVIPPLPVVYQTVKNDRASAAKTTTHQYCGLKSHNAGRGLMGFTTTTASCALTDVSSTTEVEWDSITYTPTRTTQAKTVGDETTTEVSILQARRHGSANAYYHLPVRNELIDSYGHRTITTRNFLPSCQYAVQSETTIFPEGHRTFTEYDDYAVCHGRYLPQTVVRSQLYYQSESGLPYYGQEWHYDTTTLQYDSFGRVTSKKEHDGTASAVTTNYSYDLYGNVVSENKSASGVETVTRQYQYDSTGRFLTKCTDRGYIVKEYTHDLWGNVLTETDKTRPAYPQTTRYTYDKWGNIKTVITPDSLLTTYKRGWGAILSKKYYVLEQGTARPWVKTWYDSKGREVLTESIGQGELALTKTTNYNSKGLVYKITSKHGTQTVTENLTYYTNGRKQSDNISTGESTSYTYGWQSVTATSNGRSTTTRYDSWGNIVESTDAMGNVTTYSYASCGKPSSVTSCEATVTMEYDEVGNQTKLIDPDAGTMTYTYDAYGRIKTQKDGRNNTTTNTYDAKGRLSSSSTAGTATTYTYGENSGNMGLLLSTSRSGNTISYAYDRFGRDSVETRSVSSLGTRMFRYTYGNDGQLSNVQYPGTVNVGYQYDSYGNRSKVTVGGTTVWQMDNITAQNSAITTTEQLGSGLKATQIADLAGRVTGKSLQYIYGVPIRSMTFTYNAATGNMTGRNGMFPESEVFTYDDLDRLTCIDCGNVSTKDVSYASNGNITMQTDIGRYYYEGTKPHAVTAVDNTRHRIPTSQLQTQYNVFGKVSQIRDYGENNYKMLFDYGPDNERWRTRLYRNTSTLQRTTYYMGDYEEIVEGGTTRKLYFLGNGVLYKKQTSCPDSVFYLFTDHLGSVIAIVDQNGSEKFHATYDAWGNQTVTCNDIKFHRGYTGHEMLPEFGLINMNGRLYDPQIGRFLSTDNYVQEPWNSQNFNRYSYCLNNPLKYTDPDGEFIHILIGAAIGGIVNLTVKAVNGQINSWGDGFSAFGIGAAAGAVGAATGGVAFALAGGAAGGAGGFIAGAVGGAVGAAFSMPVQSAGNHAYFGDPMMSGEDYLIGIGTSALLGGAVNGAIAKMNGRSFFNGTPKHVRLELTQLEPVRINDSESPLPVRNEKDAITWPNPDYVEGTKSDFTIPKGSHIDRYAFNEEHAMNGSYLSTPDVPFEMRSLPYTIDCYNRYEFEVLKPLPGMKSLARPFFNQPGNGFQFQAHPLPGMSTIPTVQQLQDAGFIRIIISF